MKTEAEGARQGSAGGGGGEESEDEATSGPPPTRWRWLLLSFVFPAHAVRGPPLQTTQVRAVGRAARMRSRACCG